MLRIIPTAAHTLEDVEYTVNAFAEIQEKLLAGKFKSDRIASLLG
jgi:glycine C-acetyltransferase